MRLESTAVSLATCCYCGEEIETNEWHPAVIEENGEAQLLTFCEQACKEQWQTQSTDSTQ